MNLVRLRKLIDTIIRASSELRLDLEAANANTDPLAVHIYQARRSFRESHRDKQGKRQKEDAWRTYSEACNLGYQGSEREWFNLMRAWRPVPPPDSGEF